MLNSHYKLPQILLRNWPLNRGVGHMMGTVFRDLRLDEDSAVIRTTDGFDLTVLPSDLIGRHLYLTGAYEPQTVRMLLGFAAPGDTLLDIGANIGYVSACFLSAVSHSHVIAVEPQPRMLELLNANLRQWPGRYSIVPAALSDSDGSQLLHTDARNAGHASLVSDVEHDGAIKIDVRSADSILAPIKRLDLVKIDVEGYEDVVIGVCIEHFARLRPKAVLFEDHVCRAAPDGAIGADLTKIGYSVFGINRGWLRTRLTPIACKEDCVYSDYVAISSQSST
jgi:FkbM family methyltransferase